MKKTVLLLCLFATHLSAAPHGGWHKSRKRKTYRIPLNDIPRPTYCEEPPSDIFFEPQQEYRPGLEDNETTPHEVALENVRNTHAVQNYIKHLILKLKTPAEKMIWPAACIALISVELYIIDQLTR